MATRREFLSLTLASTVAAAGGLARAQSGSTPLASQWGPKTIRAFDFSRDARKLAAVGNVIQIWDLRLAARARRLPGDAWDADHVAFLRDGRSLICGNMNGFLWRVDIGTAKQVWRTGASGEVLSLIAAPDGRSFFCGVNESLQQRSSASGRVLREFSPQAFVPTVLAIAPNGAWIAAFCGDETRELVVWNLVSGTVARNFPIADSNYAIEFEGDSRSVSWIAGSGKVFGKSTADLAGGAIETKPFHLPEAFADASGIALIGDRLVSATDGAAILWDLIKDAPVWSAKMESDTEAGAFGLSHDGKMFAFAEPDGSATLRDIATGAALRKLVG